MEKRYLLYTTTIIACLILISGCIEVEEKPKERITRPTIRKPEAKRAVTDLIADAIKNKKIRECDALSGANKKDCVIGVASATKKVGHCKPLKDMGAYYKECVNIIAKLTKDVKACNRLEGKDKEDCKKEVGIPVKVKKRVKERERPAKTGIRKCNELQGQEKTDCITALAVETERRAVCERLTGQDRADCITAMTTAQAVEKQRIALCEKLTGQNRADCMTALAVETKRRGPCEKLTGQTRTDCIAALKQAKKEARKAERD